LNLNEKRIAILGLGASGESAARLALKHGGDTYVSEARNDASTAARGAELSAIGIDVEVGGHDLERIAASDLVIASPGIPTDSDILAALRARGVTWISEPEFAFRFLRSSLVGITGTNGKTTVAALTHHLLAHGERTVALGGNIGSGLGPPASVTVMSEPPAEWCVWELSSYQLGAIEQLRVDIGVITNLAPDHLDRYGTLDAYYADKARLFENADDDSIWVLHQQEEVQALAGDAPGRRYTVSWDYAEGANAFVADGVLTLEFAAGREALLPMSETRLLGRHNFENALSAALTARLAGADPASIREGLRTFAPLPHRLEPVLERAGVLWVNDSKATNVAATSSAIRSLERTLVVLLGGVDKGEDFRPLATLLRDRARGVVVYGEVRNRIATELEGSVPVHVCTGSFSDALARAEDVAAKGDAVVLSPATASFDMFTNYEERGATFRRWVEER